jgi:zinc transporter, ZIP family
MDVWGRRHYLFLAIWWGGLAAASLLIGYMLARRGLSHRTIGMVMGIGGGALISAIAYELVPESALSK